MAAINILASGVIVHLIVKVLTTLGVGFLSYTGFSLVLDEIEQQALLVFDGLPLTVTNIIGLMGIDVYISYVLSAFSAVFALRVVKKLNIL